MSKPLEIRVNHRYRIIREIRYCDRGSGWMTLPPGIVLTVSSDTPMKVDHQELINVQTSRGTKGLVNVGVFSDGRLEDFN